MLCRLVLLVFCVVCCLVVVCRVVCVLWCSFPPCWHAQYHTVQAKGELNTDEYCFLLKGGQVFDKEAQAPNPCPHWLSEKGWDNVYEADKLLAFHGISASFEQGPSQWHEVCCSPLQ